MSDEEELQSADYEPEQDDEAVEGTDPAEQRGADSATASEPEHEENAEGDAEGGKVNQDKINEAINRQHAKYREEQRRRQALEKELEQVRQGSSQTSDPEPKIAEVDPYADDVDAQIRRRDQSIREHIEWQQRQKQRDQQQMTYRQQQEAEQQAKAQEETERFYKSAESQKIDQSELNKAVETVGQYQLGQEVASYLMSDDRGPLMTTTIAKNPALLAELSLMTPYERILHLERNVRSKLNAKPRSSSGSKPPTRVKGRASDVSDKYPLTGGKVKIE